MSGKRAAFKDHILQTDEQREEFENAMALVEQDVDGSVEVDEAIIRLCKAYTGRL